MPKHLYEAASIDRASRLYTFFRITLPLVAPILLIAIIFRTMEAFKTFDIAFVMTGQPTTELISIRLYKMAFQEWQTGKSWPSPTSCSSWCSASPTSTSST